MPQFIGSTTPLGTSATFTSRWVLADNSPAITGTVFADQTGTLFVDQSGDGVNNDFPTSTAVTASTGTDFNVTIVGAYVRLRYVNGSGGAQTAFRLLPKWTPRPGT